MTQLAAPECLSEDAILQEMRERCPQALSRSGNPIYLDAETIRQASDPKSMSATFAIVTRSAQPNAHGNKVQILPGENGKGLQTTWHQVAPVVLLEHGFDFPLPIGMAEDPNGKYTVTLSEKKAVSTVYFTQSVPEAVMVFALVNEGVMRMASVGYRALKGLPLELKAERLKPGVVDLSSHYRGFDFTESILLEWSIVGSGADKGSLRQALDRGSFQGERVTQSMRQYLEHQIGDVPVSVPGFRVERQVGDLTLCLTAPGSLPVETWKQAETALGNWSPEPDETPADPPETPDPETTEESAAEAPEADNSEATPVVDVDNTAQETQSLPERTEPNFAPEDLAQAFRERQQAQQPSPHELAEVLTGAVKQALESALAPLAEDQRRLESELERRLGKLPEPTAAR